ncbi:MAG: DUF2383 domain-containing protein [Bacteriovoracaceae bacterium]|nr:DUF2383 domain-containing protein [Bacteriovoracaceae bacterium]
MRDNIETNTFNAKEEKISINEDINEILRGEISAFEAYEQVIENVDDDPEAKRLIDFKRDHKKAIDYWKRQAKKMGTVPETTSSVWGVAVESFVGVSKVLGEANALRALKTGEEHGLSHYKKMLKSEKLTDFQKKEIADSLIPQQKSHIESIDAMLRMS